MKSKKPTVARQPSGKVPELPSLLTHPLGLEGWARYEPVLLAALASEEPLLLIGPHGSAKSFLLERLAQTLKLGYRFYNASLINYDDLVGIPVPDEKLQTLKYISTPDAIWGAETVFFDEVSRTRPELQNKLFPIIHERRVQGILLEKLRYRWAAMNPPPDADGGGDGNIDVYLGAEPLDPALADRFSFIIQVPGWAQLTDEQKRGIFKDQFRGSHPFSVEPLELVACARSHLEALQKTPHELLEEYLLHLFAQLEQAGISISTRRATTIHRNVLAVHAARQAMYAKAFKDSIQHVTDWSTSALLAVQHSMPQAAEGKKIDSSVLLAAHRHAWKVSQLDEDNPWRKLAGIQDPVERCIEAVRMGAMLDDEHLGQLILDALSRQTDEQQRTIFSLALYLAVHKKRQLRATVYETLANSIDRVIRARVTSVDGGKCPRSRVRQAWELAATLRSEKEPRFSTRNAYAANLLQGLLPDGYANLTPRAVQYSFFSYWVKFELDKLYAGISQ